MRPASGFSTPVMRLHPGDGEERRAGGERLALRQFRGGDGRRRGTPRQTPRDEGHDAGARILQHQDEERAEDDDLELTAVARQQRESVLHEVLQQHHGGGTDDGAGDMAGAAQHRHEEIFDARADVEGARADIALDMGVEPAREAGEQRGEDEDFEPHAEGVDALALGQGDTAAQAAHRPTLARIE